MDEAQNASAAVERRGESSDGVVSNLYLAVLPERVRVVKADLSSFEAQAGLVRLIIRAFGGSSESGWHSLSASRYAEDGSIAASMLAPESTMKSVFGKNFAENAAFSVHAESWVVIRIGEGMAGFNEVGVAQKVCEPLAKSGITVMFVSSNREDYVLVPSSQLSNTLATLRLHFVCEVEGPYHEIDEEEARRQRALSIESFVSENETHHHEIMSASDSYSLVDIPPHLRQVSAHGVLDLLFRIIDGKDSENSDFVHIIQAENEMSMMVRAGDAVLRSLRDGYYYGDSGGGWKRLRIGSAYLDLVEVGIVSSTTKVLSRIGISVVYASTFDYDYLFVRTEDYEQAIEALAQTFVLL